MTGNFELSSKLSRGFLFALVLSSSCAFSLPSSLSLASSHSLSPWRGKHAHVLLVNENPSRRHGRPACAQRIRGGDASSEKGASNVRIKVDGMRCASCAMRLERNLRSNFTDEVELAVSFPLQTLFLKHSKALPIERVMELIGANGFSAHLLDTNTEASSSLREIEQQTNLNKSLNDLLLITTINLVSLLPNLFRSIPAQSFDIILSCAALVTVGRQFFISAWHCLKQRYANMDVLIALGCVSTMTYSSLCAWTSMGHPMFLTVVMTMQFVLLGRFLEKVAQQHAIRRIADLCSVDSTAVELVDKEGRALRVDPKLLQPGDVVRVSPEEKLLVDGILLAEETIMDESMLTGEFRPVRRSRGDLVLAGSIHRGARTEEVRVLRAGINTTLSQFLSMVDLADTRKAQVQRMTDRVASLLVPLVVCCSILVGASWFSLASSGTLPSTLIFDQPAPLLQAVFFSTSVLMVSCPCALGLAVPMALIAAVGVGAQHGMLFRSAQAVEEACKVSLLCIDKTGTITEGKPNVEGLLLLGEEGGGREGGNILKVGEEDGWEQGIPQSCRTMWRSIAACEVNVSHPLSTALQAFAARVARNDEVTSHGVRKRKSIVGKGVVCWMSDGTVMAIGGSSLLEHLHCPASPPPAWRNAGQSVVWVLTADDAVEQGREEEELQSFRWRPRMAVALSDRVREEAKEVISRLKELGIDVFLLSGDDPLVVEQVAQQVGIRQHLGGLSPLQKSQQVSQLRAQGARVAMAGDGINDIPAFAQADLSVAVAGGSKEVMQSSDLVLAASNLRLLLSSFRLARATMRRIVLNLVWACLYNVVALPVAAGLFAISASIIVPPWLCAGMMSASSVLVVSCSLSLMLFRP